MKTVVLPRNEGLVPCCFESVKRGFNSLPSSCGAMIPFKPKRPCPACGQIQQRATAPPPGPDSLVIDGDAMIIDEASGEVVAVQVVSDESLANEVARKLRHLSYWNDPLGKSSVRLSGISSLHHTFGFTAPAPLRRRWGCSVARFDSEYPDIVELLYEFTKSAERKMRQYAPDAYAHSAEAVMSVIPQAWRIAGTPWTSGIINNTAALPYHRDSGNIKGSWSAMLGARHDMDGGVLHMVDYDCYLSIPHGSISIFDGQSVLHGVTPMKPLSGNAYRYTVVVYSKSGMKSCCPDPKDEPARAAANATRSVDKRLKGSIEE